MDLHEFAARHDGFSTIIADPPWQFDNRTARASPENPRVYRYETMSFDELAALPVSSLMNDSGHLYMWCPNAMLQVGLDLLPAWGFAYKTNLVWHKIRQDGRTHGGGMGYYFRTATELVLFGVRGNLRTLSRTQTNVICCPPQGHSRKPTSLHAIAEQCSPGPYVELFARNARDGWCRWGNEADRCH